MRLPVLPLATAAMLLACGSGTIRPTDETGAVTPAPSPAPSAPVVDQDPAPPPSITPEAPVYPSAPEADSAAGDTATVEIRRIGRWVGSGIKGARRLVIKDAVTWAQFWSELGAGVQPQVDFSKDLVIAVASGERSTGGHDIAVQQVSRSGGELRIEVLESSPGAGCMTTAALTQPVDVVMVPAAGVTGWSFIDGAASTPC